MVPRFSGGRQGPPHPLPAVAPFARVGALAILATLAAACSSGPASAGNNSGADGSLLGGGPGPEGGSPGSEGGDLEPATSSSVGPSGGTVTLGSGASTVTVTIPAGALSSTESITVTQTNQPCPTGYHCYSPVFSFEPAGTAFQKPVSVSLPFTGNQQLATLFWSYPAATGYQRLGGLPAGSSLTGPVTHFSTGFVADGVDYSATPDTSCIETLGIAGRYSGETASAVCTMSCSGNQCLRTCPSGASADAGLGCVSNCGDAGCQTGCPLSSTAPSEPSTGVYPMVASTGGPDGGPGSLGSAVAFFFNVQDCQGRSVQNLDAGAFTVLENGNPLSVEAQTTILPTNGVTAFVDLVLDVSSHTDSLRAQMFAGAANFVTQLQMTDHLPVAIGIETFAGEQTITEQLAPTLDTATLLAELQSLSTFTDPDVNSTNLFGAVMQSLAALSKSEVSFETRNAGGAFAVGYSVVFTDGLDTAGYLTQAQAVAAEQADSHNQVIAVAMQDSTDYNLPTLTALTYGGQTLINSPNPGVAEAREFPYLATYIAGEISGAYLLGYCSPKRANANTVTIEVANTNNQVTASLGFNASGFGPGCSAQAFGTACAGWQCGGLGCGGCDDSSSYCTSGVNTAGGGALLSLTPTGLAPLATNQCESDCVLGPQTPSSATLPAPVCGGMTMTNAQGYSQTCSATPPGGCLAAMSTWSSENSYNMPGGPLLVDNTNLYFFADAIESAPLSGGSPTTLSLLPAASSQYSAGAMTQDAQNLYWIAEMETDFHIDAIWAMPKTGGIPAELYAGSDSLSGLALAGGTLYFGGGEEANDLMQIATVPDAGAATVIATASAMMDSYNSPLTILGVEDGNVYVVANANNASNAVPTVIEAVAISSGTVTPLVSSPSNFGPVTMDSSNIYYFDPQNDGGNTDTLMKVPLGGSPPSAIVSGLPYATALVVDASSAYFTFVSTDFVSHVATVPLAGGAMSTLVSQGSIDVGIEGPLAVDDTSVYWTTLLSAASGQSPAQSQVNIFRFSPK
jgi:hypothetical protein